MSTPASQRVYNDRRWKIIRRQAIIRDHGVCQLRLPGCTHIATHGDHVTALEDGGMPFSLTNTQASCNHCNVAKENLRRRATHHPPSRTW